MADEIPPLGIAPQPPSVTARPEQRGWVPSRRLKIAGGIAAAGLWIASGIAFPQGLASWALGQLFSGPAQSRAQESTALPPEIAKQMAQISSFTKESEAFLKEHQEYRVLGRDSVPESKNALIVGMVLAAPDPLSSHSMSGKGKMEFRQALLSYDRAPTLFTLQVDCEANEVWTAIATDGAFRYVTKKEVALTPLQRTAFCSDDWANEVRAFKERAKRCFAQGDPENEACRIWPTAH